MLRYQKPADLARQAAVIRRAAAIERLALEIRELHEKPPAPSVKKRMGNSRANAPAKPTKAR